MIPKDITHLTVKVLPQSSKRKILSYEDNVAQIMLKQRAENNKANEELCTFLEKYFQKPVKILRGKTSPKKEVKIG